MDFYEAVVRRRMVRNYTAEPVAPEVVGRMLDAARRSPSAGHSQGISFVVVTDAARRAEIATRAGEDEYVAKGFEPWISRAPVHVVVCVSEETYRERYRAPDKAGPEGEQSWPVPYWWVDAGAALMTLLVAAVAEGLAAGFLGVHAFADLEQLLGLPGDVAAVGVVTIGHPAPDRRSGSLDRGRKPVQRVVHHEHWGDPGPGPAV